MNDPAYANLLAVTPELRERFLDWKVAQRYRVERGYDYAPAEGKARAVFVAEMQRLAEVRRDAELARRTLEMGR